jgi:hypothetical protein
MGAGLFTTQSLRRGAAADFSRGVSTHGRRTNKPASRQRRLNSGVADATREYSPLTPWVETHGYIQTATDAAKLMS